MKKATLVDKIREKLGKPLILLTLITIVVASFLATVQIMIGINYFDVFTYLNVALFYAGVVPDSSNILSIPPLIPFLTSLVFRTGFISSSVIIILNAIIFVFGVIGLYLLFKLRFTEIQSFTGCLIYMSLPLIFSWAASGSIDVPAISFSIWAIYFMVLGMEKNSKYIYLVFPMFALAILTRYTAALLIFPLLLYLIIGSNFLKDMKPHLKHILIALGIISPVIIYVYYKISYLSYVSFLMIVSLFSGKANGIGDAAYNPDNLYYLYNLLNYIGVGPVRGSYYQLFSPSQGFPSILAYITTTLVLCGIGIYIYRILQSKFEEIEQFNKLHILRSILLVLLITVGLISFFYTNYLVTDVIVFSTCLLVYKLFQYSKIENIKLDLLFFCWFLTFFIMHSVIPVKVDRYIITAAPAIAYFIILGLSVLIEKYKTKIKNEQVKTWGLYCIVGLIFLTSSSITFIGHTPNTCLIKYVEPTCQWLEEYDPNYQDKVIFSDYSPAVSWSIKKMVTTGVLRDYNNTDEFSSMLVNSNAEYYIDALSETKPTLKGYHVIKQNGHITIYQKTVSI